MTLEFDGAGDHFTYSAFNLAMPFCVVAWVYVDNTIAAPLSHVIWIQDGSSGDFRDKNNYASLNIFEDNDPAPGTPSLKTHVRHARRSGFGATTVEVYTAYHADAYDKWLLVGGLWTSTTSRSAYLMEYSDRSSYLTATDTANLGGTPSLSTKAYIGTDSTTNNNGRNDYDGHIGALYVGEHTMTASQFKNIGMGWSPYTVFNRYNTADRAYWELDERGPTTGTTPDFISGKSATFPGSGNDPTASVYPPPFRRSLRVFGTE